MAIRQAHPLAHARGSVRHWPRCWFAALLLQRMNHNPLAQSRAIAAAQDTLPAMVLSRRTMPDAREIPFAGGGGSVIPPRVHQPGVLDVQGEPLLWRSARPPLHNSRI